ncbi:MAG: hypothetical protein K6G22_11670, partial [Lachnospiraceae bacterium]|nr:hypothetical protein [Lachnospiraceae bacterium]
YSSNRGGYVQNQGGYGQTGTFTGQGGFTGAQTNAGAQGAFATRQNMTAANTFAGAQGNMLHSVSNTTRTPVNTASPYVQKPGQAAGRPNPYAGQSTVVRNSGQKKQRSTAGKVVIGILVGIGAMFLISIIITVIQELYWYM